MKVVLIGSVCSSEHALDVMLKKDIDISMVFSLDEEYSKNVSGYVPIHKIAQENNVPYKKFKNINDKENVDLLKKLDADYIFVIGLSQLVGKEVISCAKKQVIGYHPAPLPKFRGRAAIVWQILLGVQKSAVTLFCIDDGIDSGKIICQEPFEIDENDYPEDIFEKCVDVDYRLFSKGIDLLLDPDFEPVPQDEKEATYLLKRSPRDGKIDWSQPGSSIARLVRATSKPYPGAFASYENKSDVIFWRAEFIPENKYIGFNGQIISVNEEYLEILCQGGILRVSDYENIDGVKMISGHRFM